MARLPVKGRSARVEFRARPAHKALWESLVDREDMEDFTDWMIDAANERAARILERQKPGSSSVRGFPVRRPTVTAALRPAAEQRAKKPKPRRRAKR